jgi:hypothetical protein
MSNAGQIARKPTAAEPVVRKRTAVLVVHGMGNQRPFDTVRGVINAVWFGGDDGHANGAKRAWVHPEKSGVDIDLPVFTTNEIKDSADHRSADFHELYWAHLMSETRAVAVLLWLFEQGRKGPRLKPEMNALWWGIATFLCLMVLAVTFLLFQWIERLSRIDGQRHALVVLTVLMLFCVAAPSMVFSALKGAHKLAIYAAVVTVISAGSLLLFRHYYGSGAVDKLDWFATYFLPALYALLAVYILMGGWGVAAFGAAYVLSVLMHVLQFLVTHQNWSWLTLPGNLIAIKWNPGVIPWNLNAQWSAAAAWSIIVTYLILNALFLQSYLGDAARYFRNSPGNVAARREIRKQAVDTLEALHTSGHYDRIIVVAHSLGTVVAYDMLRAYFARVCRGFPTDPNLLGPEFDAIDGRSPPDLPPPPFDRDAFRKNARTLILNMVPAVENLQAARRTSGAAPHGKDDREPKAWLVTDFVTMGSPLTHAKYLMCNGNTEDELEKDFQRRVREREFPTCPPEKLDDDGLLTFENPTADTRQFHHGALFGLTRWTNLYFPLAELFWGDAIGGPVEPVFGNGVLDVKVFTKTLLPPDRFAHTTYWNIKTRHERLAPHIVALRRAIDLADDGTPNLHANFTPEALSEPSRAAGAAVEA